jgi:Flp pilus assembly protein TadD
MPSSAIVRSNLALTYYLEGDLSAAEEQAGFAVGLEPDLPAARDVAGHVALELGNKEESIAHFQALTRLEPTSPDAHSNLGLAYYRDDRLSEAIDSYQRVLVFAPNSPEGHNDLGLAYAKDKMLEEAARHLVQVIKWRPNSPIIHSNLGLVYYFKGDTEEAVHEWREVTRLSPRYARLREATRFSAYDDQEMAMRSVERRARAGHMPLKIAAFRQSFQLALDERDYRFEVPWPEVEAVVRFDARAAAALRATLRP